ncbi:hypothetical protein ACVIEO_005402 [Rhizobium leguminosarum]
MRDVQRLADLVQQRIGGLSGRPGRYLAVGVPQRDRIVPLHGGVRHHGVGIGLLQDDIRFRKALRHLAGADPVVTERVGVLRIVLRGSDRYAAVVGLVFVDDHLGIGFEGFPRVEDCRQVLIVDLDQITGLLGNRLTLGCDRCHRLADIADLSTGEQRLVIAAKPEQRLRAVLVDDDGMNTRQGLRAADIDVDDLGMRARTALDLCPKHPWKFQVDGVFAKAGDFSRTFLADDVLADDVEFLIGIIHVRGSAFRLQLPKRHR